MVAQRCTTAGCQRYESLARSRDMIAKSGPVPVETRSRSRSVIEATMTARAPGTVSSTSRFHLRVRCGGQSTSTRSKPAMCAAEAAMKVLPVPISPTTVVPRCASSESAAPRIASACAPSGARSRGGSARPGSEGR